MKLKEVASRGFDILWSPETKNLRIVKVRVVAFNNWVNVNYSRGTGISKKVAWCRLEFAEVQQLSDRCKKTNLMVHFVSVRF